MAQTDLNIGTNESWDQKAIIKELADRAAIEDLIRSYALSMDTRDWELHASIFLPEYKLWRKGKFIDETIEKRVERLDRFTRNYAWTQHMPSFTQLRLKVMKHPQYP